MLQNDSLVNLDPLIPYSHHCLVFLPHIVAIPLGTEGIMPGQTDRQMCIIVSCKSMYIDSVHTTIEFTWLNKKHKIHCHTENQESGILGNFTGCPRSWIGLFLHVIMQCALSQSRHRCCHSGSAVMFLSSSRANEDACCCHLFCCSFCRCCHFVVTS